MYRIVRVLLFRNLKHVFSRMHFFRRLRAVYDVSYFIGSKRNRKVISEVKPPSTSPRHHLLVYFRDRKTPDSDSLLIVSRRRYAVAIATYTNRVCKVEIFSRYSDSYRILAFLRDYTTNYDIIVSPHNFSPTVVS